jgi:hypothetical protein
MFSPADQGWRVIAVAFLLAAATLAVYWPVTGHPFVAYDDGFYVVDNPGVTGGLGWQAARWAFTTFREANWHPLTWLSHQLDVTLFGLAAGRHHLVNLLLHTANTLLLFTLLNRLTGALWRPATVAALFALHPLHVESVAWVAERKDLLCALFVFLSLLAYQRYVRRGGRTAYGLALGLFVLALLAKPMAVTLPLLLLLLDWWPLARFGGSAGAVRRLLEKSPFFACALASAVVTVIAQRSGGAVISLVNVGLGQRLANACVATAGYLGKTVWPTGLAPLYPFPLTIPHWQVWGAAALLVTMVGLALWQRRRRPWLAFGCCWYLVMLVPVSGLVQVGQQGMADRYTYLPLVGIFIATVWGVTELLDSWRYRQELLGATALGILALSGFAARQQLDYWRDSETLFRRALAVTFDNFVMHHNLGNELERQGRLAEAVAEHARAVALRPFSAESRYFLANALYRQGRVNDAVANYRQAIRLKPDYGEAHNNLGAAYHVLGQREEAIRQFREALRLDPADAKARQNLAGILAEVE